MIIIRYDSGYTQEQIREMEKNLPSGGSLVFLGAGYDGVIDPEYLKFAENYRLL
jgi:hypothetical protein